MANDHARSNDDLSITLVDVECNFTRRTIDVQTLFRSRDAVVTQIGFDIQNSTISSRKDALIIDAPEALILTGQDGVIRWRFSRPQTATLLALQR